MNEGNLCGIGLWIGGNWRKNDEVSESGTPFFTQVLRKTNPETIENFVLIMRLACILSPFVPFFGNYRDEARNFG